MKRLRGAMLQARLERAAIASGEGYWERDLRSGQIWYSDRFHEMLGFAPGGAPTELLASRARIHPEDLSRYQSDHDVAVATLGRFNYEVRYLDGSDQWRWIRGRCQVFAGDAGQAAWIVGVVAEVQAHKEEQLQRERRQLELEQLVNERTAGLQAALAQAEARQQDAERATQAKSRFLAHMSHEVRTPLNGVLGLTELALSVATSPEQRRFLETAHESGQALLGLLNDVLDLSRIEASNVDLRQRPFEPAQLLADAMRGLLPLSHRRELLTIYDWDGDSPWLLGDGGALRQVLVNLLGNAIKFTEHGHIMLEGVLRSAGEGRCHLTVRVSDTGPGVPLDRREAVFDPFVQGDETLVRRHGGAGLGLAIARRLVEAMDGSLTLRSPESGGAVFTVDLELPEVETPEDCRLPEPPPPGRVWLLYERPPGGSWLSAQLRRMGWQAELIYGFSTALDRAAAGGEALPDAVLVTQQTLVPGVDLAALRAALPQACVHLVVRPDWHDPELAAAARAARIETLVAPLAPSQLRRLAVPPPEAPADEPAALAPATVEILLVEDNPVNQMLGLEFLRVLGLAGRVAADGYEAIESCLERPPALVLMDLQMPRMDGLQATRELRALQAKGRWPGCPIVALTAHASPEEHQACQAAGMDGVLTKPLSLDAMREQIWRRLPAARSS